MARSIWNGAISIQDLDIPCKVFAATESHTPHFRELHEKDGAPIEHRRVSAKTGREISSKSIVKGYETSNGRRKGGEIKLAEEPETPSAVPDLMEALRASLKAAKEAA